jgi:deoxycytidylate deaminase
MSEKEAAQLIQRDRGEPIPNGQRVADAFHMSDFFVRLEGDDDKLKKSLWRILDILFGRPTITPTFQEYAMFLAFAASLRSADLARQVGAVVTRGREILATGANDCPRPGGGLYWPEYDKRSRSIKDDEGGRDYTRGKDSNQDEKEKIAQEILDKVSDKLSELRRPILTLEQRKNLRSVLLLSRIKDITEFGRPVHAEMEALISCARNGISTKDAVLYSTTFPCHNCAKHIVAAGIRRVVYVEPYPKSKVAELNDDSIAIGFSEEEQEEKKVRFEPFVGVGPRRFFDLFSMKLGSGRELIRKSKDENKVEPWGFEGACLRTPMSPYSYLKMEQQASIEFSNKIKQNNE